MCEHAELLVHQRRASELPLEELAAFTRRRNTHVVDRYKRALGPYQQNIPAEWTVEAKLSIATYRLVRAAVRLEDVVRRAAYVPERVERSGGLTHSSYRYSCSTAGSARDTCRLQLHFALRIQAYKFCSVIFCSHLNS